jgi:hypothetical protein
MSAPASDAPPLRLLTTGWLVRGWAPCSCRWRRPDLSTDKWNMPLYLRAGRLETIFGNAKQRAKVSVLGERGVNGKTLTSSLLGAETFYL